MSDCARHAGFVTTVELRTGSVGESSAPRRNDFVQPRSVSACVTSATSAAVIGIANTSFRAGMRHEVRAFSFSTSSPSGTESG